MASSASGPAEQKEKGVGNLMASPCVLSDLLRHTAVTKLRILVLEGGRICFPGKHWFSYMAFFWKKKPQTNWTMFVSLAGDT